MKDTSPSNQKLMECLKQIANKLDGTGEFIESVAFALANQYKFIAARMPGLEDSERAVLTSLAQQALDGVTKHKETRRLLRDAVQQFSRN